jgi:maleate isomerase
MEPEFYAMSSDDISIHTARMILKDVTVKSLEHMTKDAVKAERLLSTAGVDIIVYGCTSGSLIKGVEWEENLVNKLQKATGIQTITTARAVVEALSSVRATVITVMTPYIDELNELEKMFLEAHDFRVSNIKGLGFIDNLMIGKVSRDEILGLIDVPYGSDCLFISCTNLPVTKMIQELECQYNVPVITSNQASLWLALRSLNQEPIDGYGTLMRARKSY